MMSCVVNDRPLSIIVVNLGFPSQDRKEFEEELTDRFGHIVKIPVLKENRSVDLL